METDSALPFWFSEALEKENPAPPLSLDKDLSTDVCIVGGGYTGLWTAIQLKLQQADLDIVLIEKDLCGSGASGRNGGCMLTWAGKYLTLRELYGTEEANRLVSASENALIHIRDFCKSHDIEADVRLDGVLNTATNSAQLGALDPAIQALEEQDLNHWERWPKEDVQKASGSSEHLEGFFSSAGGSLQPGILVRGLRRVAKQLGVQIYEKTPFIGLEETTPVCVNTPGGKITAKKVVLALNAWMPTCFPAFRNTIMLVSSDMAITEPVPDILNDCGFKDGKAVIDSRAFVHYYRRTSEGRLMMGKGGNLISYGNRVSRKFDEASQYFLQLRGAITRFFPALSGQQIETTWTGPSDRSATGLPFFGMLNGNKNILYGFGYSGNGVGQCYVGGQFLSAMALEQDNEWTQSLMAKGPLRRFPPEPFRWFGAIVVKNAIQRKERMEDRGLPSWWIDRQLAKVAAVTAGRWKPGRK
ncbi:MAG: FAD-dependent oxidoreductase [Sneathiella sp.]